MATHLTTQKKHEKSSRDSGHIWASELRTPCFGSWHSSMRLAEVTTRAGQNRDDALSQNGRAVHDTTNGSNGSKSNGSNGSNGLDCASKGRKGPK